MMTTMVEFRALGVRYCLPVETTRAVRSTVGMVALPAPGPNVAGLLPGDPPLTVLAPYGADGEHVIVLHVDDQDCGLLVECVIGLRRIDENEIRPAPRGQERALVSGSVVIDGEMVLLADPRAILLSPDGEA